MLGLYRCLCEQEPKLNRILLGVWALVISPLSFADYNWSSNAWELVSEQDGIVVYRKDFPGSNVKGVAGSVEIEASLGKIIGVLMDHQHKHQWLDKFQDARTLSTISPVESVQYGAFTMPFPASDRDFVYSYRFTYNPTEKMVEVDVASTTHPDAPETKSVGVRGRILRGKYRLYSRDGGKKTFVEVEYQADPMGLLPTWIVNVVQKKWPYKTLKGLRSQAQKPFVKDHPMVHYLGVKP